MTKWRPADFITLIVAGTASLCMLIVVCGVMAGMLLHLIDIKDVGSYKGAAVGSGLLGILSCVTTVLLKVAKHG